LLLPRRSSPRFSLPFWVPLLATCVALPALAVPSATELPEAAPPELIVPLCLAVAPDFVPVAGRVVELAGRVPVDRVAELPWRVAFAEGVVADRAPVDRAAVDRAVVERAVVVEEEEEEERAAVERAAVERVAERVADPVTLAATGAASAGTGGTQLRNMMNC
jgi:hypothetical protein